MAASVFISLLCILFSAASPSLAGEDPLAGYRLMDDMAILESSIEGDFSILGASRARTEFWEDGVLPIRFQKQVSAERRALFLKACTEWSRVADVRCQVGDYRGRAIQVGKWTTGCWAIYGMGSLVPGLRRRINLSDGCWSKRTILHEIGHALGLIHEHQRPDRDAYVEIFRENVDGGALGLNRKVNFDVEQIEESTPYDFLSIMHYHRKAFSKNGKDTILPRPPYEEYRHTIGKAERISDLDAEIMSRIYGPPTRAR